METRKKKYGWTVRGILGFVFGPMGLLFLSLGLLFWYFRVGDEPEDPEIFLYVFGGMGAAFLLVGLILLGMDLYRRARLRRAYEGGYFVMAKIAGKSAVENVSFHNGRHPWVVECHYTDPATGTVHVFYSRYLNVQVMDLLKSDEVPVYLDRMDQRVGFVDIDAVLPEIKVHGPGY
ncbi:MAG: hypothetical protein IJL36_03330 [Clostridia bacterium]|jgi:hypothetical protein|nr:hypothetical protein [Clostridia bacterium]